MIVSLLLKPYDGSKINDREVLKYTDIKSKVQRKDK